MLYVFFTVFLFATSLVFLTPHARAQNTTAISWTAEDFELRLSERTADEEWRQLTDLDAKHFLSIARCQCHETLLVDVRFTTTGSGKIGNEALSFGLYWGNDCQNPLANANCVDLGAGSLSRLSQRSENTVDTAILVSGSSAGGESCEGVNRNGTLWVVLRSQGETLTVKVSRPLPVFAKRPAAPTLLAVDAGDGSARARWKRADESAAVLYQPLCMPAAESVTAAAFTLCPGTEPSGSSGALSPEVACASAVSSGSTEARIAALRNGQTYQVSVVAIDEAGNASVPSQALAVTPAPTLGFSEVYASSGGEAIGGCSLAPIGMPHTGQTFSALLVLLLVALTGVRGRRSLRTTVARRTLVALILVATVSASAFAQESGTTVHGEPHAPYAPPRWSLDVRLGMYRPAIDSEFERRDLASRPYQQTFGGDKHLLPSLDLGRILWSGFGTVTASVSGGYFHQTARAFAADGVTRSADQTGLLVVPLSASLIYRFEDPRPTGGFPIEPFVLAGGDYFLWWMEDPKRDVSGATAGWHAGGGLALSLDRLAPEDAKAMRNEAGISGTALTLSLVHHDVRGLGAANKLNLGDTVLSFGLGVRF